MLKKPAGKRARGNGSQRLHEKELSSGFEHAKDFPEGTRVIRNMMKHPKIKNRIKTTLSARNGFRARLINLDPVRIPGRHMPPSQLDLIGIKVKRFDKIGMKKLEDDLNPDSPAAADFQGPASGKTPAAETKHRPGFSPLEPGAKGAVHQQLLSPIQFHRRPTFFSLSSQFPFDHSLGIIK